MAKTFKEFRTLVLNKGYDVDGYYGTQCWDGAMYYSKWLGYPVFNCPVSGYAKDIWNLRKTSGILNYYKELSKPKVGALVIFGEGGSTPDSHIGIVSAIPTTKTITVLGQNQGGKVVNKAGGAAFNEITFYTTNVLGYLYPKCFITETKNPLDVATLNKIPTVAKKINKTFKVTADTLNIYEAPNTSVAKKTTLQYKKGMKIKVDCYLDHDGYRWIGWASAATGKRHWAKRGTLKNGKLDKAYGKFI